MVEVFVAHFTYIGIFLVLFVAGLGVPIPEEAGIVAAAALSHAEVIHWWIALPVCLAGVLCGDVGLYWSGWHFGVHLLDLRLVRLVLTPEREARLTRAYRRHAAKTVFTARHVMGLRAAAFLTAGIARVPFWKFILVDTVSATLSVPIGFWLAYFFTDQIGEILRGVHRAEHWLGVAVAAVLLALLGLRWWWRRARSVLPPDSPPRRHRGARRDAALPGGDATSVASGLRNGAPRPTTVRNQDRRAVAAARAGCGGEPMKVKDVMIRDIVTIDASANIIDAAKRMRDANVGVLPVVDNGRVHGVVTDRDLVVRALARNADPGSTHVADCATKEPVCARPDWDVDRAMSTMADEQVGRLPVIDEREQVVGIVTLSSLALRSQGKREALETAQEVSRRSARA